MSTANIKTILVVDDSATIRRALNKVLTSAGFQVREAANGQEGLDALTRLEALGQPPALIVTDLNMPIMDGITLLKRVKEGPMRFVPVLVLSSEDATAYSQTARSHGAAGWLSKPMQPQALLATVKKFTRSL